MTPDSSFAAEIDAIDYSELCVLPEYIDVNGHMNIGYYSVLFDHALREPFYRRVLGGVSVIRRENVTSFAVESHLTYQREVKQGDPLRFRFRVIDLDAKRAHLFMAMYHAKEGWLSATHEWLTMCVDLALRRTTAWPRPIFDKLAALHAVHKLEPKPAEVGRVVGIRGK